MPVRLKMTSCSSTTDVVVIHGVDKERLPRFRRLDVDPAQWRAFAGDQSGALVGERQLKRSGWKVGEQVELPALGVSFTIHGTFATANPGEDFVIYVGRDYLQQADEAQGESHHALVRPLPGADVDALSRAIDALPLTVETQTRPEHAAHAAAVAQLADLVQIGKVVVATLLAVMLIGVGNAMAISTRERSREFGIMRTLGFRPRHLLGLVLGEGLAIAIAGALLGILLVELSIRLGWLQGISTCGFQMTLEPGLPEWLASALAIGGAGLLATLIPAWGAMRVQPVRALGMAD